MILSNNYEINGDIPKLYHALRNLEVPFETTCHKRSKVVLQIATPLLGLSARIPAVSISRKFGGNNQAYGWSLATANVISYGSLVGWSFLKLVNGEMRILSQTEKDILTNSVSIKSLTKAALLFIGLFSQIPFAYMAYEYNNNSIPLAILILIADSAPPIYSLHLSVKKSKELYAQRALQLTDPERNQIREQLIDFLEIQKKEICCFFKGQKNFSNEHERSLLLFPNTSLPVIEQVESNYWKKAQILIRGVGYLVTLGRLTVFSALAYKGANDLLENQQPALKLSVSALTASIVFASNAYLIKDVVVKSSLNLIGEIKDRIHGKYYKPAGEYLRPRLHHYLRFLTLGLTAISYSTPMQVAEDTLAGDDIFGATIPGIEKFVEIGSTITVLLLVSNSMRYFTDELVSYYILKKGSQEEKDLVLLEKHLCLFIELLQQASLDEVFDFLNYIKTSLPENCNKLKDDNNASEMELSLYNKKPIFSMLDKLDLNINKWIFELIKNSNTLQNYINGIK